MKPRQAHLTMRGPSGLGDAIYLRVVAEHIAEQGVDLEVLNNYPDVFCGAAVTVKPFVRGMKVDIVSHYVYGKNNPGTNQFQDMCIAAKLPATIPLRFDWKVMNRRLVDDLRTRAAGRKIIVVHGGRTPMARTDGFGAELLPLKAAFDLVLGELRDCFLVRVGKHALYPLAAELDLQDRTTVTDLIDIGQACDGWVAQCSFAVPLAEAFDKPLLAVWAAAGLRAKHGYVKSITPQKILSKSSSTYVFDDWQADKIKGVARAFRGV